MEDIKDHTIETLCGFMNMKSKGLLEVGEGVTMGYCANGQSEITISRARMENYGQGLGERVHLKKENWQTCLFATGICVGTKVY